MLTAGSYEVQTAQPCLVGLRADRLLHFLHALFHALLRGILAMVELKSLVYHSPDQLAQFLSTSLSLKATTATCMTNKCELQDLLTICNITHSFSAFVYCLEKIIKKKNTEGVTPCLEYLDTHHRALLLVSLRLQPTLCVPHGRDC